MKNSNDVKVILAIVLVILAVIYVAYLLPEEVIGEKPEVDELIINELSVLKKAEGSNLQVRYRVENSGTRKSEKIELRLKCFKSDLIRFEPNLFTQNRSNTRDSIVDTHLFICKEMEPGQFVDITIITDFKTYLQENDMDTLVFDDERYKSEFFIAPKISNFKCEIGKAYTNFTGRVYLERTPF